MNNNSIFQESKKYMPGGVNSPVRAFTNIDRNPPIIKGGKGAIIWDEEGNEYIDFVLAWGPMILGHCNERVQGKLLERAKEGIAFGAPTKLELEMSKFICENIEPVEMIRMVNSGTEATMSAIKLARGYTGKNKIVKFSGCYHGHFDGFLVKAGSGVLTEGIPGSLGIPEGSIKNTLIAEYNDCDDIEKIFNEYGDDIAAVILEPVAGNMGVIKSSPQFVKKLRELCDKFGSLLVFDEVMSGFRVAFKGAQSFYEEKPDLITFAKIIGGGLPSGAYGGRRDIMEKLSPLGGVYQAGTMSGNPLVMATGLETLKILKDNPEIYDNIDKIGSMLEDGLLSISKKYNIPVVINRVLGMMTIFFTNEEKVNTYHDVETCDEGRFNRYFIKMLEGGINLPPSQYESFFLSSEHNEEHVAKFLKIYEEFCKNE